MKLIKNKADAGGLILLAVIVLAAVALALAGRGVGLFILSLIPGLGLGHGLVYFPMRRWGAQRLVATLALVAVVAPVLLAPLIGLWLGDGWLLYPSLASESPISGFFFGLAMGAGQAAFATLMGFPPRAGD